MFLISGFLFLFPFSSPGITKYQGEIPKKTNGLMTLTKILLALTLTILYTIFTMVGYTIIGDVGLLVTLTTVCYSLVPIEPLPGRKIFTYRKELSIVSLALMAILLYAFTMKLFPLIIYLCAGIAAAVIATINLLYLRRTKRTLSDVVMRISS